jgi:hypothetical protein
MEEGKFLADAACVVVAYVDLVGRKPGKDFLLNGSDLDSLTVKDLETFAPRELTLYGVDGGAVFIENVVAVKPRKESLLE